MPKELQTDLISDRTFEVLGKFMIFSSLSREDIKTVLGVRQTVAGTADYHKRIIKLCRYDPGETVIREGNFDSWSFWVVKGRFDVVKEDNLIASFSKPGEIFGEMSVFDDISRTASVVSADGGVCLCIDMSVLENINDVRIKKKIMEGFQAVTLKRLAETKNRMKQERQRLDKAYDDLVLFEKRIKNGREQES